MRRHGSYRRRGGISGGAPLSQEPQPPVLCGESDTTEAPVASEGEALPPTSGEGEALPLLYEHVALEPVADENAHVDPLNDEPLL